MQSVTYADLAAAMLGVAVLLRDEYGVVKGDRVALLAHNSVAYLAVSFGAMCLGSVTIRTLARPSIRPGMRNAVRLYGLIDKPTSQNAC